MYRPRIRQIVVATVLLGGMALLAGERSEAAGPGSVPYWRSEEGMTAEQINRQRAQQEAMRLRAMEHRMRMSELRARQPRIYITPQPSFYRNYNYYYPQQWYPGYYPGYYYFGY